MLWFGIQDLFNLLHLTLLLLLSLLKYHSHLHSSKYLKEYLIRELDLVKTRHQLSL